MAKKAKKLQELSQLMEGHILDEFDKIDVVALKELAEEVDGISDPRDTAYVRHKLSDILMIILFAVMAGANEWSEVEEFGKKKEKWLRKFLNLEHGVPTDDTYRLVISKIKVTLVYYMILGFFMKKVSELTSLIKPEEKKEEKEIISIDGKVSAGSKRQETENESTKALHTLNAYSSEWGMCVDQEFIDEKSNEIPAAPILINRLNIKGSILTWDALNTQKETVKAVIDGKGDYVGALKGNHGNLYKDTRDYFNEDTLDEIKTGKGKTTGLYKKTVEKEHSAVVTREYYLEPAIGWLYEKENWAGLSAIGAVVKKTEKNRKEAEAVYEVRYYISSLSDINDFARAARSHWCRRVK